MQETTGADATSAAHVTSAYAAACQAYENKLTSLKNQLNAAALKAKAEPASMTDGELRAHIAMMKFTYESTLPNLTKQLRTVSSEHQTKLLALQQKLKTTLAAAQEQQECKADSQKVDSESDKDVAQLLELRTTQLRTSIEAQYTFKAKNDQLKGDLRRLQEQVAALKKGLADQVFTHHIYSHAAYLNYLRVRETWIVC